MDLSPARLVMPAVRWAQASGFQHEIDAAHRALDLGVGGFIIFGGTPSAVRSFTEAMTQYAGRPLLIGSDLERGAGQQIEGLTEFPPPGALGALGDDEVVRFAARTTAVEARQVGINWVFAPVADLDIEPENPIVQSRSFGTDPASVARRVRTWVESCQTAGALACVKHYPGHGRTTSDSHAGLPVVGASAKELMQDEEPFRAAIEGGVASVMTAHVAYPALDPTGTPATFSRPIIQRLRSGGFDGLVVTDALIMEGAKRRAEGDAASDIVEAGLDLLLYPRDTEAVVAGLTAGLATGALTAARVEEAHARYNRALLQATQVAGTQTDPTIDAGSISDRLLDLGMARGRPPQLRKPLTLTIIDDDIGGPYSPHPEVEIERHLQDLGIARGSGGSDVILVFAEPRGWKSRAGLSRSARERLTGGAPGADHIVLFGHPRLVEEIPGSAPVLVAWHRQRLMQQAVARWMAHRVSV